ATGLAPAAEVADGCHCMAPDYLRDQLARSRTNLGLETIDLYYLHNIETQRGVLDGATFRARLSAAARTLEEAAAAGHIGGWGLATWDGLRVPPEHPEHLSIEDVLRVAREAGGPGHHFRSVQLPFNLAMAQALVYRSQSVSGGREPALAAAAALGVAAFGSASLLQGRLAAGLSEEVEEAFPECESAALAALQFARAAPGLSSSLVGVSSPAHARRGVPLPRRPPAAPARPLGLFRR